MPVIKFTRALKRFYPELQPIQVQAQKVSDIVQALEQDYPGLKDYIVDERGALRQHVNIFIDNQLIADRTTLQDEVKPSDEIYIMQALSGG